MRVEHARGAPPDTQHMPHRRSDAGEHSDWAGSYRRFNRDLAPGMCLVSGTNQGMYARVRPHPHKLIVSSVDHAGNKYGPIELLMDPEVLLKAAASGDSYFSYIFGVAYQIAVRYNCRGLVIENYKTDLPQAKGLSSVPHNQPRVVAAHRYRCCYSHLFPIHACYPHRQSAAATVLAARAFNRVYDLKLSVRGAAPMLPHAPGLLPEALGLLRQLPPPVSCAGPLSNTGEMDLAYHGEITTPSQCGRMDQCCAHACLGLQVPRWSRD